MKSTVLKQKREITASIPEAIAQASPPAPALWRSFAIYDIAASSPAMMQKACRICVVSAL
jgi:hypothetical protein